MITSWGVIEVIRELDSERLNDYWRTPSLSAEISSVRDTAVTYRRRDYTTKNTIV